MTMKLKKTSPGAPMELDEYTEILREEENQPPWRSNADKEMDYVAGNQLGSDLLQKQQELGIPPAIEDLTGPAIVSLQGYEAATRTDWRVTASGETGGQDVADGINSRLNQAERESKADRACGDAFATQAAVGIGWVEVSRESDPFKFKYRCSAVHRNEIAWDMQAKEPDLSDARWLRRKQWMRPERLALVFPKHKAVIKGMGSGGADWYTTAGQMFVDGGASTGLQNAWNTGRGWTVEESRWYNPEAKELCVSELWYRRWESVPVLTSPDGRVMEFDEDNRVHMVALATGMSKLTRAITARVRRAYWLGPHLLDDSPSPYPHAHFPYVPFWGFREDRTGVPFGYVRGMVYQQDALNSGLSKMRWGMSSVRTERTKGAVEMTDAQYRRTIGRVDADIILNKEHMQQGGIYKVSRDFEFSDQQHQMLMDARAAIERVSGITPGFMGKQGTARSGLQEQTQVEQSNQSLGKMMDNFRSGRSQVGELLMVMIIEDMGEAEQTIIIEGDAVREDRTIVLNKREIDPLTGETYLSNDVQRTRLKVALEDVPSTKSYRAQQLSAMSEAVKSLPDQYKAAIMPFMVSLMDVPFKRDVIEALRAVDQQQTPEQIEERIKQEVQAALVKAGNDLKARELDLKERKTDAEIKSIVAQAVLTGVQSAFSSMQAAGQIVMQPQIAPVADAIMQGAGYRRPSPGGDDPQFPQPQALPAPQMLPGQPAAMPEVRENTSPTFPPVPQAAPSPMAGIETATPADNLQGAPA